MEYKITLNNFEGPLDLLFHLIEKNEIDIYDIPIVLITNQYIEYLDSMEILDMDIASEFLVMASTLIEIKSKMLLPKKIIDDDGNIIDEDPREFLVSKLIEYKKFKNISIFLKDRESIFGGIYFKSQDDLSDYIVKEKIVFEENSLDKDLLIEAVKRLLKNAQKIDGNRKKFFRKISRDKFTVEDKINYIKDIIKTTNNLDFESLIEDEKSKSEIIVTFLAVLELLKLKEITIEQKENFDKINITRKGVKHG